MTTIDKYSTSDLYVMGIDHIAGRVNVEDFWGNRYCFTVCGDGCTIYSITTQEVVTLQHDYIATGSLKRDEKLLRPCKYAMRKLSPTDRQRLFVMPVSMLRDSTNRIIEALLGKNDSENETVRWERVTVYKISDNTYLAGEYLFCAYAPFKYRILTNEIVKTAPPICVSYVDSSNKKAKVVIGGRDMKFVMKDGDMALVDFNERITFNVWPSYRIGAKLFDTVEDAIEIINKILPHSGSIGAVILDELEMPVI